MDTKKSYTEWTNLIEEKSQKRSITTAGANLKCERLGDCHLAIVGCGLC